MDTASCIRSVFPYRSPSRDEAASEALSRQAEEFADALLGRIRVRFSMDGFSRAHTMNVMQSKGESPLNGVAARTDLLWSTGKLEEFRVLFPFSNEIEFLWTPE